MKTEKNWARLLAYLTGLVNQELLLQNEYLAAENRLLRAHLPSRLRLSHPERETLAEIGKKRLGRKALARVACVAKPDTILAWYRKLVAQKFNGSKHRSYHGRPRISPKVELLIVQFARECALGLRPDRRRFGSSRPHRLGSDNRKRLRRHGIAPAPKRSQTTTWKDFITSHLDALAGVDFLTAEVLTWSGLATYYVLFFIHLESRRVTIAPRRLREMTHFCSDRVTRIRNRTCPRASKPASNLIHAEGVQRVDAATSARLPGKRWIDPGGQQRSRGADFQMGHLW
jgi:putative transposase